MFQLTKDELESLKLQIETSKNRRGSCTKKMNDRERIGFKK
jgi:hypothetical protein